MYGGRGAASLHVNICASNFAKEIPENLRQKKFDMSEARESYLSWDEYFMSTAFLSAMRSKDPVTQVGAVIVNSQKRIVGIGYNGMPRGTGMRLS